jgi:hypothetical protein
MLLETLAADDVTSAVAKYYYLGMQMETSPPMTPTPNLVLYVHYSVVGMTPGDFASLLLLLLLLEDYLTAVEEHRAVLI